MFSKIRSKHNYYEVVDIKRWDNEKEIEKKYINTLSKRKIRVFGEQ